MQCLLCVKPHLDKLKTSQPGSPESKGIVTFSLQYVGQLKSHLQSTETL